MSAKNTIAKFLYLYTEPNAKYPVSIEELADKLLSELRENGDMIEVNCGTDLKSEIEFAIKRNKAKLDNMLEQYKLSSSIRNEHFDKLEKNMANEKFQHPSDWFESQ